MVAYTALEAGRQALVMTTTILPSNGATESFQARFSPHSILSRNSPGRSSCFARLSSSTSIGLTHKQDSKPFHHLCPQELRLYHSQAITFYQKLNANPRRLKCVARVATPLKPSPAPEMEQDEDFDASALPPFTLADIRAAIPKHCWEKNTWKSMSYVARDVAIVLGLAAAATHVNSWFLWPVYWLVQGTMFWALFVLGHDCGHGSFSQKKKINSLIGHLTHSSILVPYHGWRISHRTHHQNHGHVENDESWHPVSEKVFKSMDYLARFGRFKLPWAMLAYPIYLWGRSPGKQGSHYDPGSPLFVPSERKDVITSTVCWGAMVALLAGLTVAAGPVWMFKLYFMPYWINVIWLDLVTYLHHHGYEKKVPWYRGKEWNYMRGGLSTIDRDYGLFNNIHHDIGTHVVHHLFPQIPHYHLIEATEAVKPILGGLINFVIGGIWINVQLDNSIRNCGVILSCSFNPPLRIVEELFTGTYSLL
ncbi:hypothetical protein O6H91_12G035300 [Diphasiastrum complanatum]|uniref:Uncharacterized protein n=1 Tax=Diphasiastrum complanatum TaxID=34168 RepID=A0ACC2C0A1_DIPCM|nr:hypothetical protein O6H91_12G035300 [Diphasiastrum complanatum]